MEFPDLGERCKFSQCSQLDFLPIACTHCKFIFCKEHILPHVHQCEKFTAGISQSGSSSEAVRYNCHFSDCKKWELTPVLCSACSQQLCLDHRHQVDHQCSEYKEPVNQNAEAAAQIQRITNQMKSDNPKKSISKKSEKMAAKVQLMKLKMKAVGEKCVPSEDKLFLLVLLPKSHLKARSSAVFVSQHWSIGRAIDSIANLMKLTNNNNIKTADKLKIFNCNDGSCISSNMGHNLKDLLAAEEMFNGQSIILEYVPNDAHFLSDYSSFKTL